MRNLLSFVMFAALVVVLLEVIAPAAGLGMAVGWSARQAPQVIDRTNKSDRLDAPQIKSRRLAPPGAPVPVGCEAVFSTLSKEKQANFPGRCLA
ncbi:MAG TPA: hypothetical protein VFB29_11375 [Pseudolabrys sp.]|nr:hypothetical protein [Pseudolabrys sp.]